MILSFKTKINGKPTYFVEKIHSGLLQNDLLDMVGFDDNDFSDFDIHKLAECEPKIHTIRKDEKNRWKPGMMIDFFINARQKDMFRFAPKIKVKSIETIEIIYSEYDGHKGYDKGVWVLVDDICIADFWVNELAKNDGFDSTEDFFNYFKEDFKGIIIHWTDFLYIPEGICYISCESCLQDFDVEDMEQDDDSNWFCPECWKELAPVMKAEYEELVIKGEIEKNE